MMLPRPTTRIGIGSGTNKLIAAAMPPKSAPASMVLPINTPIRIGHRSHRA